MSERSGSVVRQSFETIPGEWRTRIIDFPDRYLRSRVQPKDPKYRPILTVLEIKRTTNGLTVLTETIKSFFETLDLLESYLGDNYTNVASPNSETTPAGFEHYFHTPLAFSYNGRVQIKMVEVGIVNEKLSEAKAGTSLAQIEDIRRYGGRAITPIGIRNYYQSINFRLAQPSSLRIKSLISQALESL